MKNKTGKQTGFLFGLLLAFLGISIFSHFHPEEDFAGITIVSLLFSGLFFSIIGSLVERYLSNKKIENH